MRLGVPSLRATLTVISANTFGVALTTGSTLTAALAYKKSRCSRPTVWSFHRRMIRTTSATSRTSLFRAGPLFMAATRESPRVVRARREHQPEVHSVVASHCVFEWI